MAHNRQRISQNTDHLLNILALIAIPITAVAIIATIAIIATTITQAIDPQARALAHARALALQPWKIALRAGFSVLALGLSAYAGFALIYAMSVKLRTSYAKQGLFPVVYTHNTRNPNIDVPDTEIGQRFQAVQVTAATNSDTNQPILPGAGLRTVKVVNALPVEGDGISPALAKAIEADWEGK